MTNRNVCRALTAAWLTCGVTLVAPALARAQDVSTLPKGHVTLVGCFVTMADPKDPDDGLYVLANPTLGPATTVADANCVATGSEPVLRLTKVRQRALDSIGTGRVVEIYGELGRMRDADDIRKFEVDSFRQVPVTPPRTVLVIPIPAAPRAAVETPQPEQHAETPEPAPVATAGIEPKVEKKKLPKTATPLPLIAMLGFFAVAGGLVLGAFDRRRALGRG